MNFPITTKIAGVLTGDGSDRSLRKEWPAPGYSLTSWSYPESLQGPVEPAGGPPIGPVPCAVAADDGTGACQDALGIGVLRHAHAVIHAGG